ncbi:class I SAM-dependent methyltransferase [Streptomyces sp. NPDC050392]|uniref:class I SAM-dependent methyltransferase n=1 Tax=Streptomyces sp. NPDC050392 TaxID=3155782 RepID=UPI003433361A
MTEFAETAPFYAAYRPGIPDAAVRLLTKTVQGRPRPVLLDLGSGTGQVPAALHAAFAEADVVERDPGMIAEAEKALALFPAITVRLHNSPAELFAPPHPGWQADLVTICRAFHWMDQPAVLNLLDRCTTPDATVAVMGDGSLWTARSPWTDALRALIQEYTGAERRAGKNKAYTAHDRPYREILAESAFPDVEEHTIAVDRTWTPQTVIGYLYSTSFASRPLIGGDAPDERNREKRITEFEDRANSLLGKHAADGQLLEQAHFDVLLARRP